MDTKGWDIIYIASTKKCNENLAKNMSGVVSDFSYQAENITLEGSFSNWQIVNGGSDKYVHFEMPIASGKLNVNGEITDLTGVTPIMSIRLDFVGDPTNTELKHLQFDLDNSNPAADQGAVFTITVDARSTPAITPEKNPVAWGILNTNLPEMLIENKEQLSYIFAQISLVPPETSGWLAPKQMEFAYLDANAGFFVVFTNVTDKDTSALPRVPDTSILDSANDLFVCMSEQLVLQQMIEPGLPAAFGHGATTANFDYQVTTSIPGQMDIGKIVNVGNLSTDTAKWGLDTYYPEITNLEIVINNNQLQVSSSGDFAITGLAGASCSFTLGMNNTFCFDPATQDVSFLQDPNPSHTYSKHIPWYDWVIVAPFFFGLVALILELVTNSVTDSITKSISVSQNSNVSAGLAKAVSWTGFSDTAFNAATLSQGLTFKATN